VAVLRILIAPTGFKECLRAEEVAAAIAHGVRRACPDADVMALPLADGGEGFARTLVGLTDGTLRTSTVRGPLGEPVDAAWGLIGGTEQTTAVIDMASAAGLSLIPPDRRNPLHATTYGVGELIRAALDEGARHIVIGCGDSGTNDAGAGMAQALGMRLRDRAGREIRPGGLGLLDLAAIDRSGLDPRIAATRIEVACNIQNLLCGPQGVARVYGPQKGASAATVRHLEKALGRFAAVVRRSGGPDVSDMPGGGSSGGLGAGLHALLGASLHARYDILSRHLDIDSALSGADLVFTGEGGLDGQSGRGKLPGEIGERALRIGVPVIALAGTIGAGAGQMLDHGIGAYFSTVPAPCALDTAIANAATDIAACAENVMRSVMMGMRIAGQGPRSLGRPERQPDFSRQACVRRAPWPCPAARPRPAG
jgi:glycerate kinase